MLELKVLANDNEATKARSARQGINPVFVNPDHVECVVPKGQDVCCVRLTSGKEYWVNPPPKDRAFSALFR